MFVEVSPDELFRECLARQWNRLDPRTADLVAKLHGFTLSFTEKGSLRDLTPGSILYTTSPMGTHCVSVVDVQERHLIVHDPLGKRGSEGSDSYDFSASGENNHLSMQDVLRWVGVDGTIWLNRAS